MTPNSDTTQRKLRQDPGVPTAARALGSACLQAGFCFVRSPLCGWVSIQGLHGSNR